MIAERTGAPGENEQNLQAHRERQDRGNDPAGHARFEPRNDESGADHERRHDRRVKSPLRPAIRPGRKHVVRKSTKIVNDDRRLDDGPEPSRVSRSNRSRSARGKGLRVAISRSTVDNLTASEIMTRAPGEERVSED